MTHARQLQFSIAAAALLLAAAAPAPAAAQQDVMRDSYRFLGSALEVEVATDVPGRLRMLRGRRSRIEVSGRAPDGFTSAALGGNGVRRLSLTSMGGEHVDFVVIVPEDVRVRVNWAGSNRSELFGPLSENAVYDWDAPVGRPGFETIRPAEGARPAPDVAGDVAAPAWIDVIDAHLLDRLTIHVGERAFAIDGTRRFQADGETVTVTSEPGADVTIRVSEHDEVTIALDGVTALVIDRSGVHAVCDELTAQELADGSRWFTFAPSTSDCAIEPDRPARAAPHRRT